MKVYRELTESFGGIGEAALGTKPGGPTLTQYMLNHARFDRLGLPASPPIFE